MYYQLWKRAAEAGDVKLWRMTEVAALLNVEWPVVYAIENQGIAQRVTRKKELGFRTADIPKMKVAADMLAQVDGFGNREYRDWEMVTMDFPLMYVSAGLNWIIHQTDVELVIAVARKLEIE